MTWRKREIMEMARDSHMDVYGLGKDRDKFVFVLEAFAELVRADEAEKFKWDIHSCGPTCTKIGCVAVREAVKAEREAIIQEIPGGYSVDPQWVCDMIRARSNP